MEGTALLKNATLHGLLGLCVGHAMLCKSSLHGEEV